MAITMIVVAAAIILIIAAVLLYSCFLKMPPEVELPVYNKEKTDFSGWNAYENKKYRYQIKYPQGAAVKEVADEEGYINSIPESCVAVSFKYGIIYIRASDSTVPCGPTNIATGAVGINDSIVINGVKYEASGYRYDKEQMRKEYEEKGMQYIEDNFILEFLMINPSGINIIYGIYSEKEISDEECKESREAVKKIVESFKILTENP